MRAPAARLRFGSPGATAKAGLDIDWSRLSAPILLIAGEKDAGVPPAGERDLAEKLRSMGKDAQFESYAGAGHAFFNDSRPEAYNALAAADSWRRTIKLFHDWLV